MIVYGALIVVVIITAVFYFINPKEYKWWEFFIPILITLGMIVGVKAVIDHSSVLFSEYWGETIVSVFEQEPYNYWQHQTCSRQVPCGTYTDSNGNTHTQYCTEYYDCSHQVDVGPSWDCKTDLGNDYKITEHLYDSLLIVFGNKKSIINTHKNYDSNDRAVSSNGTKFQGMKVGKVSYIYEAQWPGTDETRKGVFTKHSYENRIKASDLSLFNIPIVTPEQADSMGLYNYPERVDKFYMPTILGQNISPSVQVDFRKLNAKFGPSNQLRLWILVFEDKPAITATYQENYWVKGNKNELVICIGKKGQEIQWAHAFSWGLNGTLTAEVASKVLELYQYTITTEDGQRLPIALPIVHTSRKEAISDATRIDTALLPPVLPLPVSNDKIIKTEKSNTPVLTKQTWMAYYDYLNENLGKFERRHFEEFSYLKVSPKRWQVILIYILATLISGGLNLLVSTNEISDQEKRKYY